MAMRAFAHCQEFMVQFCYSALNQIDSRQIASFVLLSIFVVYLVNKSGISTICHGAWQVVKAVVRPIIVIPVLIVFLYSIGVMAIAYDCALWSLDISLDVVIEIIVVGIPLAITSACESRTLRQAVVNMVGPQLNLSAILEFYCGLVSFALPAELLIQACLSFLIGAKLLSRKEWGTLSAVIEGIIGLFGITLVCMVATVLIGLRTSIDWHAVFQSVANILVSACLAPHGIYAGIFLFLPIALDAFKGLRGGSRVYWQASVLDCVVSKLVVNSAIQSV